MALQAYAVNESATVFNLDQKRAEYMGNPQVDDGYTKIANELYEAIVSFPFTSRQIKIVLSIIRKTYGFNKKADRLAQSVIAEMTGIAKPHVCKTLKELSEMKVLFIDESSFSHVISLNKSYLEWDSSYQKSNRYQNGSYQNSNETVTKTVTKPLPKQSPQKKERNKERESVVPDGFELFWNAYGKKTGKANAIREWKKVSPDQELIDRILTSVKSMCAARPDPKYRKDPERWIKGRMWEDDEPVSSSWMNDPAFAGGI